MFEISEIGSFDLADALGRFHCFDDRERATKERMLEFLNEPTCFQREHLAGHFTGSAWLLHPSEDQVLLTHHRKLDNWLQLGGHADGDAHLLRVAMTEAVEESGITSVSPLLAGEILDIDIHPIPERRGVPRHEHFDVRFALRAHSEAFAVSEESHALAWIPVQRILTEDKYEGSLKRLASRWVRTVDRDCSTG